MCIPALSAPFVEGRKLAQMFPYMQTETHKVVAARGARIAEVLSSDQRRPLSRDRVPEGLRGVGHTLCSETGSQAGMLPGGNGV